MPHVYLSGRLLDASLLPVGGGELLLCTDIEWEEAQLNVGDRVRLETPTLRDERRVISEVTLRPGGEPEAIVILSPLPPPPPPPPVTTTARRKKRR